MNNIIKIFLFVLSLLTLQNLFAEDKIFSEQSMPSHLAINSLLLESERHQTLTIVVGERGHILYSNNNQTWLQATVATKQTLTNIFMHNEQAAWAVGHDAVIVKSIDGAKTWEKVFSDIKQEAPLLDVYFRDEMNGIAIGAYSMIYVTADGGISWQRSELLFSKNNANHDETDTSKFSDTYDFHLNAIAYAGEKRFYIASEAGHILRSDDDAKTWVDLPSPYHGSFFGILPLSFNEVIAYGLRGHLYRSTDAGITWAQIETTSTDMLTNAVVLTNGNILVTGLAGTLLLSKDGGKTFLKINLYHRHGLSSVLEAEDGSIVFTGDTGIEILSQDKLMTD